MTESQTIVSQYREERQDESVWDALFETAEEIGREFDIQPSMPRLAQRARHRANPPANYPSQYWQRALYYPFIDHISTELHDRLLGLHQRYLAQYLIPTKLHTCTEDSVHSIYVEYASDIPLDEQGFRNEVARWKCR